MSIIDPPADTQWELPGQLGYPDSIQTAATTAAPMLAGFSLTIAVLLLPDLSKGSRTYGRWGDLSLGLLFGAAIVLVMAVQCAMVARSYQIKPDELLSWWGRPDGPPSTAMLANQKIHAERNSRWSGYTRATYNLGILLLLAALPLTTLPPGHIPKGRWVVAAVAGIGFPIELVWAFGGTIRRMRLSRHAGETQAPASA